MADTALKLILVADDYEDAAALLAQCIERHPGFEAWSALDGQELLELASRRRPCAAVLDINMPKVGGVEAAKRLREMFVGEPPLLVAITGASLVDATSSQVFDHVLIKPFDTRVLLDLLEGSLGKGRNSGGRRVAS